ncbi:T9SS type A sorting domain-containing protein [Chitinophaga sp. Mgbs1]|uniref:T9SS type A sorting domain-containing protein n=1 Tax=Chitinophaga solisilvae TaxID=1233460 RepID=A0A433WEN9_9BACT|nr:T9SS type A sorting domain-containing protein [Chitinophaga solisilvae]
MMKLCLPILCLFLCFSGAYAQSISGSTNPCPGTAQQYTANLPCSGASITWSVYPGNATISGSGTTVNITFEDRYYDPGVNKVIADYSCDSKTRRVELSVNVKAFPSIMALPQYITLPCNFKGNQQLEVDESPYADSYKWENNTGWPVVQGAGTRKITYNVTNIYSWSTAFVKVFSVCPDVVPLIKTFNFSGTGISLAKPTISAEVKPLYICKRSPFMLSVNDVPNATDYIWSADQPTIRINGQVPPVTLPAATGKNVTITNTDDVAKTAVISCQAAAGTCSASAAGTITLQVNGAPPPASPIFSSLPIGHLPANDYIAFSIDQHPAATSYQWQVVNGTIRQGQGTNHIWVSTQSVPPKHSAPFFIVAKYLCECGESEQQTASGRIYGPNSGGPETFFSISPNPASDILRIHDTEHKSGSTFEYHLYDMNNQEVRRGVSNGQQSVSVNIAGLKAGQYVIQIRRDGKISSSHILIQKTQ